MGVRLLFGDGALRLCGERSAEPNERLHDQGSRALFQITLLFTSMACRSRWGLHPKVARGRLCKSDP